MKLKDLIEEIEAQAAAETVDTSSETVETSTDDTSEDDSSETNEE